LAAIFSRVMLAAEMAPKKMESRQSTHLHSAYPKRTKPLMYEAAGLG